ncbi:MAG: manganese efflux pump MntP family protein [Planctomycetota bacterium]
MIDVGVVLTALALAVDAIAICVAAAVAHPSLSVRSMIRLPVVFGVFQGLMPAIGWACAATLHEWIEAFDHWIAFALLAVIGLKMIVHGIRGEVDEATRRDPLRLAVLISLAIATSLDALAAGFGFFALGVPLLSTCFVVAAITTLTCIPALGLGRRLGSRFGRLAEPVAGLVLIGLGVRIVIEHMAAH